ncbi:MAG TPA: MFS transporter [Solirubrobacteraceae bacterium]|nr:MFS transporter [Solirubrobacteraceae bacterium]
MSSVGQNSRERGGTGRSRRDHHAHSSREGGGDHERPLKREEKIELAQLALPTFALALAITIVSTQLGEVARSYTHQTILIGAIVGGEGVMALWVPLLFGSWSDVLRTRIGGRLPFVLAGGIPAAVVLALIGFLHGLGLVALVTALFFFFYFIAYEPYRAMYPDMLPSAQVGGRSQSAQAVARGVGTGFALLGGGLLLSVARPLPFVVASVLMVTAIVAFVWLIIRRGAPEQDQANAENPVQVARKLPRLIKEHPALRAYFWANAMWETALSALKAFIILYLTLGLRYSLSTSSLIVGGVALIILVGAGGSGKLADRFGRVRVVSIAVLMYGAGYLVPIFTTSRPALGVAIPFIALGGGTVMTMAYALLMPLMPGDEHGALTGFYSVSRGVGVILGPVIAGALIWISRGSLFRATHGFQAMWIVCSASSFLSLLFLWRLSKSSEHSRTRAARAGG